MMLNVIESWLSVLVLEEINKNRDFNFNVNKPQSYIIQKRNFWRYVLLGTILGTNCAIENLNHLKINLILILKDLSAKIF